MARNEQYDVGIIGAGPGGYVAAIRAAQLGLKPVVIEKDKPGGVCLNIGCIPSKSLIHQAAVFQSIKDLATIGIKADPQQLDYEKVFKKSRQAANRLSKGVRFLLEKNKIKLVEGEADDIQSGKITLKDGNVITAKNILLATGSRPRQLPGFEFDEETIISSTGALLQKSLPEKVLILGSGAIGAEFAHIMNAFGVEVYLVEILDQILPLEDAEIVEILAKSFKKRGIKMMTGTKAVSQEKKDGKIEVLLEDKEGKESKVVVDKVLVSAGRVPNTEGLGLEKAGIKLDEGKYVITGDYYQTDVPGIYAIGDIIRSPLLAHVASREGEIAVEHMAGESGEVRIDPLLIPAATYCEPQIASFGLNERQAKEKGIEYKKSIFPYRGLGKAMVMEQPEGMVKVLTDPETGEILGGHIVGAEATELLHELLLARKAELLPEDLATTIHAHPTLAESVMEVMKAAQGQAIHI